MSSGTPLYCDWNATTPVDPQIAETYCRLLLELYGNPSSPHRAGQHTRARLEEARKRIASVFSCQPKQVVFCSGATEANNLAIYGTVLRRSKRGKHIICSPIEHPSVLEPVEFLREHFGYEVTYLPVDASGRVIVRELARSIRRDTVLVCVQASNNELGTIQPFEEVARICQSHGVAYHCDAVQWPGKMPLPACRLFYANTVALSGHKLCAPKGIGLLLLKEPELLDPIIRGGGQEWGLRAGTEHVAGAIVFAEALHRFVDPPLFQADHLRHAVYELRQFLLRFDKVRILTPETGALPNTLTFAVPNVPGDMLLARLDLEGIEASGGSACTSGAAKQSPLAKLFGLDVPRRDALVRLSLGPNVDDTFVTELIRRLEKVLESL